MYRIATYFFIILMALGSLCLTGCKKDSGLPVDGDGNEYHTVTIGTQVWLKENLKTTKYCGGAPISLVTDNLKWENSRVAAYCWFNNDIGYKDLYGALYNWYVVKVGVICPIGYHVPTIEDWTILATYLIDAPEVTKQSFEALPIGMRVWNGDFLPLYHWWVSAQEESGNYAWCAEDDFSLNFMPKESGFYVRCIKDN